MYDGARLSLDELSILRWGFTHWTGAHVNHLVLRLALRSWASKSRRLAPRYAVAVASLHLSSRLQGWALDRWAAYANPRPWLLLRFGQTWWLRAVRRAAIEALRRCAFEGRRRAASHETIVRAVWMAWRYRELKASLLGWHDVSQRGRKRVLIAVAHARWALATAHFAWSEWRAYVHTRHRLIPLAVASLQRLRDSCVKAVVLWIEHCAAQKLLAHAVATFAHSAAAAAYRQWVSNR